MPISGNALADVAPRARSGASLVRPIVWLVVRLVALIGATVAALLLAAATASADDGSLTAGLGNAVDSGLGQGVGETVHQVEAVVPKVTQQVAPKVAPKVVPQQPAAPKAVAPKPQPVHLQQVTEKVNLQPTQGIPAVDDVVRGAVETVTHTVVAPVVKNLGSTVSHTTDAVRKTVAPVIEPVTHAATQVVNQVAPSTVLPPAAVLPPAPQVRSVEPVQAPAVDQARGGAATVVLPVATDVLVAGPAPSATADSSSHHRIGSAFSGLSHETPTDFPQLPTAPAQGPVGQTGSGQSAGDVAVLDAVLRDGSNGLTRLGAGDEGAPLSRAAVVDTRPA